MWLAFRVDDTPPIVTQLTSGRNPAINGVIRDAGHAARGGQGNGERRPGRHSAQRTDRLFGGMRGACAGAVGARRRVHGDVDRRLGCRLVAGRDHPGERAQRHRHDPVRPAVRRLDDQPGVEPPRHHRSGDDRRNHSWGDAGSAGRAPGREPDRTERHRVELRELRGDEHRPRAHDHPLRLLRHQHGHRLGHGRRQPDRHRLGGVVRARQLGRCHRHGRCDDRRHRDCRPECRLRQPDNRHLPQRQRHDRRGQLRRHQPRRHGRGAELSGDLRQLRDERDDRRRRAGRRQRRLGQQRPRNPTRPRNGHHDRREPDRHAGRRRLAARERQRGDRHQSERDPGHHDRRHRHGRREHDRLQQHGHLDPGHRPRRHRRGEQHLRERRARDRPRARRRHSERFKRQRHRPQRAAELARPGDRDGAAGRRRRGHRLDHAAAVDLRHRPLRERIVRPLGQRRRRPVPRNVPPRPAGLPDVRHGRHHHGARQPR